MGNTFSLTDLCSCGSPCTTCCGGCCPGVGTSTMVATFTGFPGCTPTGSWNFPWDSVNGWWGKTTVTFGSCGYAKIWFVCNTGGSSCSDFLMRFEIYDSGMVLQCSYADAAEDVFPQAGCTCSPLSLDFWPTLASCFCFIWDRGHVLVTL